jgi:hypothetical protein
MSKHPYPDAPDNFPHLRDGAPSPHSGGGTMQGVLVPPTGNAGRQPMPAIDGDRPAG